MAKRSSTISFKGVSEDGVLAMIKISKSDALKLKSELMPKTLFLCLRRSGKNHRDYAMLHFSNCVGINDEPIIVTTDLIEQYGNEGTTFTGTSIILRFPSDSISILHSI